MSATQQVERLESAPTKLPVFAAYISERKLLAPHTPEESFNKRAKAIGNYDSFMKKLDSNAMGFANVEERLMTREYIQPMGTMWIAFIFLMVGGLVTGPLITIGLFAYSLLGKIRMPRAMKIVTSTGLLALILVFWR